ncbi:MAG: PKD domain-containing protein [Brumimicrobium sp.]|nr:PKD domain-containing protein [Brumimicrobium sp.]
MKRTTLFFSMICFTIGISYSQSTQGSTTGDVETVYVNSYSVDQLEDFIIEYYDYNKILTDLGVTTRYQNKKEIAFRRFVYFQIYDFYARIYSHTAGANSDEIANTYAGFIMDTKQLLQTTVFDVDNENEVSFSLRAGASCQNMDFEDGNLNGWTLRDGKVDGSVDYSFVDNGPGSAGPNFLIVNGGTDPVTGISRLNPNGGAYSCRLGDGTGTGSNAARMYQTFNVDATNTIFKFSYAVVFQDPNHTSNQQPYFTFRVYDEDGNGVDCAEYSVIAAGTITGFQTAPGNVRYKDWTTVLVDLSAYIGQNMTVEFTSGDCSQSGHYGYAYIDAGCTSPEIIASDDDALICPGEYVTLSALGGEDSDMEFLWNTGDTTESIHVSESGTYTVTLIPPIGDPVNCAIVLTKDIEVNLIQTTPSFQADTVCLGEVTHFADNSSVSPSGEDNIIAWAWDFGDGATSTLVDPSHTYANDGTYNVTLTVTTSRGCSNDTSFQVVVNPLPTANFNFTNVCLHDEMMLTDNSSSAAGINSYNWDINGDGVVDYISDTVYHTFSQANSYNVSLQVEDTNGCVNSISHQVIVYDLPIADFSATQVCEDATSVFTNGSTLSSSHGDFIQSSNWNFGNSTTSTQINPTVNYGNEGIYTVKLLVTSSFGCKDSITKQVEVYPLPQVNFSPTEVCLHDPTNFQDLSTISNAHTPNNNVQWNWDFADTHTSNIQNPIHTFDEDGTYNVALTVTSNHGCVNDTILSVIVYPLPTVSFEGVNLEGCAPVCVEISSTSTINSTSSLDKFEWLLSDGRTYSGDSFTDCFENLTGNDINYGLMLRVTSDKGCVNDASVDNYISVYHNPIANFSYRPSKISVVDPVVTFQNTSQYADYYNWDTGYQSGITDINPVVKYPFSAKEYIAILVAYTNQGCTDTARAVIKINDDLIFYVPNTFTPDNDGNNEVFTPIFSSGVDPDTYTLHIFNRWGEVLFESHDVEIGWKGTYSMDSNNVVRDGTYIWKIEFKETMSDRHHSYIGHVNVLR